MKYLIRFLILVLIIPTLILWGIGLFIMFIFCLIIQRPYHFIKYGELPNKYDILTSKYVIYSEDIFEHITKYCFNKGILK